MTVNELITILGNFRVKHTAEDALVVVEYEAGKEVGIEDEDVTYRDSISGDSIIIKLEGM